MTGKGKYDDVCAAAFEVTKARAAVLLIADGIKGSGFSVVGQAKYVAALPDVLRQLADQIEKDMRGP